MNILFVTYALWDGGSDRVISTLANNMSNKNNRVSILMISANKKESYFPLNDNVHLVALLEDFKKKPSVFKKKKLIRKAILDINPDIVISFISFVCIYVWLALRKTNIPYIVSERNDPNQRGRIKQFLLNRAFRNANGCVFQTDDAMEWYKRKNINNDSVVIHNPVNLTYIPKNPIQRVNKIISVGRLAEQKNPKFIIDSFLKFAKSNQEYELIMYGDGGLRNSLEIYIQNLNVKNVRLLHSNKNWHQESYNAKAFLLGSKYEGMPNALEEALCLGIPSISTNCSIGGPKELKKYFGNSLFLSNENIDEFSQNISKAVECNNDNVYIPNELTIDYIVDEWICFMKRILNK